VEAKLEGPILPESANVSGGQEREAGSVVGGILSEDTVNELTEKLGLLSGSLKELGTEIGGLHEAVESCNGKIPRGDQPLGHVGGHEGFPEIFHGGRLGQLLVQVGGGVRLLLVEGVDRAVGEAEVTWEEKLDGEVGAARLMEFSPTFCRNMGREAQSVDVIVYQRAEAGLWKLTLGLFPKLVKGANNTREEPSRVQGRDAVIKTAGDVYGFQLQLLVVGGHALVQGRRDFLSLQFGHVSVEVCEAVACLAEQVFVRPILKVCELRP
jgi:hypothetical protein